MRLLEVRLQEFLQESVPLGQAIVGRFVLVAVGGVFRRMGRRVEIANRVERAQGVGDGRLMPWCDFLDGFQADARHPVDAFPAGVERVRVGVGRRFGFSDQNGRSRRVDEAWPGPDAGYPALDALGPALLLLVEIGKMIEACQGVGFDCIVPYAVDCRARKSGLGDQRLALKIQTEPLEVLSNADREHAREGY